MRISAVLVVAASAAALAGCAHLPPPSDRPVQVVAGFYPLQFVTQQVGGDRVTVTSLAAPGAEPHDLELSPRQVASIVDAHLVVYLGGFQPAVDEAVRLEARKSSIDVATRVPLLQSADEHAHGDPATQDEPTGTTDPHLWLDPTRLATVAHAVADRLAAIDPVGADGYRQRAERLVAQLAALDAEYRDALTTCARHEIVVSHAAFGYMAQRYGLDQVALSGLSPDAEPPPRRLAEVAATAREHHATTIFFESLVSPRVAEAIAGEVGAVVGVLDPIEGPPEEGNYLTAMRSNLNALIPALGCQR